MPGGQQKENAAQNPEISSRVLFLCFSYHTIDTALSRGFCSGMA